MVVSCPGVFSLINLSSVQFINNSACYKEFHWLNIDEF